MKLYLKCKICNNSFPSFEVDDQAYSDWKGGKLIQRAMPSLSPDQREMLIFGTCPDCWNDMFSPE